jgi:hypothetical protein
VVGGPGGYGHTLLIALFLLPPRRQRRFLRRFPEFPSQLRTEKVVQRLPAVDHRSLLITCLPASPSTARLADHQKKNSNGSQ